MFSFYFYVYYSIKQIHCYIFIIVDAGRAGFGNLEMAIKDSDQCIIPSHVSQLEAGTAKFLVTFNPTTLGVHTVNITFNKEVIMGSPFEVHVVESLVGETHRAEMLNFYFFLFL